MDIVQAAKSRYSTKVFDPTRKLPQEKIDAVKELIRFSPSSVNSQPWSNSGAPWKKVTRTQRSERGSNLVAPKIANLQRNKCIGSASWRSRRMI